MFIRNPMYSEISSRLGNAMRRPAGMDKGVS